MANNKDFKVKNGIQPTVYHEAVGTVVSGSASYSLTGASYDSVSFSVAAQDTLPEDIFFKPDGLKMYIVGSLGEDINEYDLSIAWDISTASYLQNFSVSGQDTDPTDLFFKADGTKMYIVGTSSDSIHEYDLSTAWDISTSTFLQSFSVAAQETTPNGLFFKSDGTKLYVVGQANDAVSEYDLSTAWDISTASYLQNFSVATEETSPSGLFFKPDGTRMFIPGIVGDAVCGYNLSTAWDVSSASYLHNFSVITEEIVPNGLFFKPDGTKLYVVGQNSDTVYQYSTVIDTETLDLSTGSVFEITPTSDIEVSLSNPVDSGTVSQATLVINYAKSNVKLASQEQKAALDTSSTVTGSEYETAFKTDGTKMYILDSNEVIYQFTLNTAWDISTASYDSVTFTLTQGTAAEDIYFKSDGTKLYSLDVTAYTVYQYSLSTAWDISTASYDSVSFGTAGELSPQSMEFSADGTSLYIGGNSGNGIDQYTLSTAWDLSTAGSGVFTSFSEDMDCIALSSDGAYLATLSTGAASPLLDHVKLYELSTAWDVSTAVAVKDGTLESQYNATTQGITFGDDDKFLYITHNNGVVQCVSSESYTITYATGINFKATPFTLRPDETDVVVFTTRDGGTSYTGTLVIDGAK